MSSTRPGARRITIKTPTHLQEASSPSVGTSQATGQGASQSQASGGSGVKFTFKRPTPASVQGNDGAATGGNKGGDGGGNKKIKLRMPGGQKKEDGSSSPSGAIGADKGLPSDYGTGAGVAGSSKKITFSGIGKKRKKPDDEDENEQSNTNSRTTTSALGLTTSNASPKGKSKKAKDDKKKKTVAFSEDAETVSTPPTTSKPDQSDRPHPSKRAKTSNNNNNNNETTIKSKSGIGKSGLGGVDDGIGGGGEDGEAMDEDLQSEWMEEPEWVTKARNEEKRQQKLNEHFTLILHRLKTARNAGGELLCQNMLALPVPEAQPDYEDRVPPDRRICFDMIEERVGLNHYKTAQSFDQDLCLLFSTYRSWMKDPLRYVDAEDDDEATKVEDKDWGEVVALQRIYQELTKLQGPSSSSAAFEMVRRVALALDAADVLASKRDEAERMEQERKKKGLKEIKFKDKVLKVGDWVHLHNPDNPSKPVIGQIFRTFKKSDSDTRYINVFWYYRPEQTVHPIGRQFYENEVAKTASSVDHVVEDYLEHCFVQYHPKYIKGRPKAPLWTPEMPIYVCEHRYKDDAKTFDRIKSWNSVLPKELKGEDYEMDLFPEPMKLQKLKSPFARGVDGPGAVGPSAIGVPEAKEAPSDEDSTSGNQAQNEKEKKGGGKRKGKDVEDEDDEEMTEVVQEESKKKKVPAAGTATKGVATPKGGKGKAAKPSTSSAPVEEKSPETPVSESTSPTESAPTTSQSTTIPSTSEAAPPTSTVLKPTPTTTTATPSSSTAPIQVAPTTSTPKREAVPKNPRGRPRGSTKQRMALRNQAKAAASPVTPAGGGGVPRTPAQTQVQPTEQMVTPNSSMVGMDGMGSASSYGTAMTSQQLTPGGLQSTMTTTSTPFATPAGVMTAGGGNFVPSTPTTPLGGGGGGRGGTSQALLRQATTAAAATAAAANVTNGRGPFSPLQPQSSPQVHQQQQQFSQSQSQSPGQFQPQQQRPVQQQQQQTLTSGPLHSKTLQSSVQGQQPPPSTPPPQQQQPPSSSSRASTTTTGPPKMGVSLVGWYKPKRKINNAPPVGSSPAEKKLRLTAGDVKVVKRGEEGFKPLPEGIRTKFQCDPITGQILWFTSPGMISTTVGNNKSLIGQHSFEYLCFLARKKGLVETVDEAREVGEDRLRMRLGEVGVE